MAIGSVAAVYSSGTWTVGNYADSSSIELSGISCTAGGCIAVGESYSDPDTETWTTRVESYVAGIWSIDPSPNVGTDTYLYDVSCVDMANCTAVGYSLNTPLFPQVSSTLAIQLVGGTWTVTTTPDPAGTSGTDIDRLIGVDCTAASNCQAVGWMAGTGPTETLALSSVPIPPHGYWLVGSDGGIFNFGSAQFYGSTGNLVLQRPVVGMVPTADRGGYWLDASDGGVFAFGDAGFYGSLPGLHINPAGSGRPDSLNAPIVGMVPSFDDRGYFMVGADGGVFVFGDAEFAGSCPSLGSCTGTAVAVMPDATGNGYWLFTSSGGVYTFGGATFHGAPGSVSSPVTSAVRTPDGNGYWILLANGTVDVYGDARQLDSPSGILGGSNPATAIFATADGEGYWVASANGSVYSYGDAPFDGSMAGAHLNGSIIVGSGF